MSEAMKNLLTRRSIRKYTQDPVPEEKLNAVIEAGLYAASARGQQSTIIVAVTNPEVRNRLSKINCKVGGWGENFDPFYGAPVVLVVLADKNWANRVYDGGCVMENLMLAAHEQGLGSCWIHRAKEVFEMPEWQQWLADLGVEGEYEGIGHCILGIPDGNVPEAAPRKEGRVWYVK